MWMCSVWYLKCSIFVWCCGNWKFMLWMYCVVFVCLIWICLCMGLCFGGLVICLKRKLSVWIWLVVCVMCMCCFWMNGVFVWYCVVCCVCSLSWLRLVCCCVWFWNFSVLCGLSFVIVGVIWVIGNWIGRMLSNGWCLRLCGSDLWFWCGCVSWLMLWLLKWWWMVSNCLCWISLNGCCLLSGKMVSCFCICWCSVNVWLMYVGLMMICWMFD